MSSRRGSEPRKGVRRKDSLRFTHAVTEAARHIAQPKFSPAPPLPTAPPSNSSSRRGSIARLSSRKFSLPNLRPSPPPTPSSSAPRAPAKFSTSVLEEWVSKQSEVYASYQYRPVARLPGTPQHPHSFAAQLAGALRRPEKPSTAELFREHALLIEAVQRIGAPLPTKLMVDGKLVVDPGMQVGKLVDRALSTHDTLSSRARTDHEKKKELMMWKFHTMVNLLRPPPPPGEGEAHPCSREPGIACWERHETGLRRSPWNHNIVERSWWDPWPCEINAGIEEAYQNKEPMYTLADGRSVVDFEEMTLIRHKEGTDLATTHQLRRVVLTPVQTEEHVRFFWDRVTALGKEIHLAILERVTMVSRVAAMKPVKKKEDEVLQRIACFENKVEKEWVERNEVKYRARIVAEEGLVRDEVQQGWLLGLEGTIRARVVKLEEDVWKVLRDVECRVRSKLLRKVEKAEKRAKLLGTTLTEVDTFHKWRVERESPYRSTVDFSDGLLTSYGSVHPYEVEFDDMPFTEQFLLLLKYHSTPRDTVPYPTILPAPPPAPPRSRLPALTHHKGEGGVNHTLPPRTVNLLFLGGRHLPPSAPRAPPPRPEREHTVPCTVSLAGSLTLCPVFSRSHGTSDDLSSLQS